MNNEITAISVIVPVYNVEKYLQRCLDSIFHQQFSKSFEVIAVEDFSSDNSLTLLREYKKSEPSLTIIEHSENKKLSVARYTGMQKARGEYIMHVDSDDWLLPNALENLYKKCKETNADIVVFNYVTEDNFGHKVLMNNIKKEIVTSDKDLVHQFFLGAPWNKMVKRSFTENMISGTVGINSAEDLLYSSEILLRVNTICLISEPYYTYFNNATSITRTVSSKDYLRNQRQVLNQIHKIVLKNHATKEFIESVLNYFEKFIYLEIARMHFSGEVKSTKVFEELLGGIEDINIVSDKRLERLRLVIKSRWYSLYAVKRRFGFRITISIIRRSLFGGKFYI